LENVQIHHRNSAAAGDGFCALFLAGSPGLDSSAADPGTALAQVQDEALELEVAPAQEMAQVAPASGSCQSSSKSLFLPPDEPDSHFSACTSDVNVSGWKSAQVSRRTFDCRAEAMSEPIPSVRVRVVVDSIVQL
jgi:hypothetical protein